MNFLKPIDGDVFLSGKFIDGTMWINVELQADPGHTISVNDVTAVENNGVFTAEISLQSCKNRVEAVDLTTGEKTEMVVYRFFHGDHTYRLGVDDVIWTFEEIWRNQDAYSSIFDHPFMALYRDLHEKYGTYVHMHLYYQNDDGSFNLSMFPDKYKHEFRENGDWLKLSFHSLADKPDRPYLHASYEQVIEDGEKVCREILRFAGEEATSRVTSQHWCECPPHVVHAFRDLGYDCMDGYFRYDENGVPVASFYFDNAMVDHLAQRDFWVSHSDKVLYVKDDIIINEVLLNDIDAVMDEICKDGTNRFLYLLIHEQYFYKHYCAYEPDYKERIFTTVDWCHRNGYKPERLTNIMVKSGYYDQ